MTEQKRLAVIDSATLMDKQIAHRAFTVVEILPAGLTLLVGAPKSGKSFLVLNLCLAVANGEPFLGFPTNKGKVLYMCLEDNEERMQNRMMLMVDEGSENLFLSSEIIRTDEGLLNILETFLADHPDTNLIVIDTLNYIRPESRTTNLYEKDYSDIVPLHKFAQEHTLSLVLVHHTRKTQDGDEYNAASGSTALAGAVDNYLYLNRPKRAERTAKLFCSGRDIIDRELEIYMDDNCLWHIRDGSYFIREELNRIVKAVYIYIMYCSCIGCTGDTELDNSDSICYTPTLLSEQINEFLGEDIPPNMIKKELTKHHAQLEELGVRFESKRLNSCRLLVFQIINYDLKFINEVYGDRVTAYYVETNSCHDDETVTTDNLVTAKSHDKSSCHAVTDEKETNKTV